MDCKELRAEFEQAAEDLVEILTMGGLSESEIRDQVQRPFEIFKIQATARMLAAGGASLSPSEAALLAASEADRGHRELAAHYRAALRRILGADPAGRN